MCWAVGQKASGRKAEAGVQSCPPQSARTRCAAALAIRLSCAATDSAEPTSALRSLRTPSCQLRRLDQSACTDPESCCWRIELPLGCFLRATRGRAPPLLAAARQSACGRPRQGRRVLRKGEACQSRDDQQRKKNSSHKFAHVHGSPFDSEFTLIFYHCLTKWDGWLRSQSHPA